MNIFENLQTLGKSLMLPVAVLPAAAILLRLGAPDVFNIPFVSQAGGAIFDNLPLIFAVGIATGIAKDSNGAAAMSGVIGYLILTKGLSVLDASLNMGVLAGILSGLTAGILYNRFHEIQLPEFLGFFGGRRFVAIVTALTAIVEAGIFGLIWSPCQNVIQAVGEWIIGAGAVGAFIYGFLNRLLIPFGLHHILNSYVFFVFGEFTNSSVTATGEINRFFAGDPTAGGFLAGFYPMMMFGMPALALAMYRTAKIENRPKIAGLLASMALTSFFTGITEPIEFSFMFLAPILYGLHAILTGLSLAVTYSFGILQGFGFSAGLIDYVLTWGLATNPALIIPIGIIFGAIYYAIFSWAIVKFNLPTIGRYEENISETAGNVEGRTLEIIAALGGKENLLEVSNCVTRLRLKMRDTNLVDEEKLKSLGAKGVIRKGNAVQVIFGLQAEKIADEIVSC